MSTHDAVVTVAKGKLEVRQVPTPKVVDNQVRVRCEWTASTPLDLHQTDGGLLVTYPHILGDGVAGTVEEVGPAVQNLKVGDKVFGFTWRNQAEKAHQIYVVTTENLLGKLPKGFTMQEAVTLPNNFVTVWHVFTKEFGFELPWPKPEGYVPPNAEDWILIWGGSSSCGMYGLQLLKYYGYHNVITTASSAQHPKLKKYGALECFDYRKGDVVKTVNEFMSQKGQQLKYILDCIASQDGSMKPIAGLAESGTRVALLLPVIIKDAAPGVEPEYTFDVETSATWKKGVLPSGVRTHFYTDNKFLADKLQSEIMPWALETRVIEPNDQVIVEGNSLLERAEKAMSMLREKKVSGGRLVWRVADQD